MPKSARGANILKIKSAENVEHKEKTETPL